jgi:hypothetical protein
MGAHSYIWYVAWIAVERHLNTMHNDTGNAWLTPIDCEANTPCVLLDITHLCSTGAYIQCSCIHTSHRMKQRCAQYRRVQHSQVRLGRMATGFCTGPDYLHHLHHGLCFGGAYSLDCWTGPAYIHHVHLHVLMQFHWITGLDQHMHALMHLQRVNRHIWWFPNDTILE